MSKFFNLTEARGLLPRLDKALRAAVQAKADHAEADEALQGLLHRIMVMGGILVDRVKVEGIRSRRESSGTRLKAALAEIQEIGCVVKDLDIGLVDFPTLFRGEEVYLCWRMGEDDIHFWHGVHEGFAGRKMIDDFFLENHQGREPS
jgi:hypothetical protein